MREKRANEEETCGKEETSHLSKLEQFGGERRKGGKEEKREEEERSEKLHLLSRIHGDRAVGFHRSKRQSSSTQQELLVGTRIRVFTKLREVGVSLLPWLLLV